MAVSLWRALSRRHAVASARSGRQGALGGGDPFAARTSWETEAALLREYRPSARAPAAAPAAWMGGPPPRELLADDAGGVGGVGGVGIAGLEPWHELNRTADAIAAITSRLAGSV